MLFGILLGFLVGVGFTLGLIVLIDPPIRL